MLAQNKKVVDEIAQKIDRAIDHGVHPIAAFDADGTLWNTDLGETFFQFQIKNKLLPELPIDPWAYYQKIHDENAPQAFMWLAQINKGHKLSLIREWAEAAVREFRPLPIIPEAQAVIDMLHKKKVEIYIVTASVQWAVEPGAQRLGVAFDHVIGVKTKVQGEVITDVPDGAVSWREGKVERLLAETKDKRPFLAAGNTMGDFALLECATHIKIANCWAQPESRIYATERKLLSEAQERGWFRMTY